MAANSRIEWCDHTFNPWWGCQRVSPGCEHCYAETFAKRTGHDVWGPTTERRFFGDKHWAEPLKWNERAKDDDHRPRVFCASMADVFEDRRDLDEPRARLFDLIERTPNLDWLLLTKRPERMATLAYPHWGSRWPSNVWAGTTTENQDMLDLRAPHLEQVNAAVKFWSMEPLLGPVDCKFWDPRNPKSQGQWMASVEGVGVIGRNRPPDWVITGGESGPKHRSFDPQWARAIRDQCVSAGVAYLHKQNGGPTPKAGGRELDGRTWDQYPEAVHA